MNWTVAAFHQSAHWLGDGARNPENREVGGCQKLLPQPGHLWAHPASSLISTGYANYGSRCLRNVSTLLHGYHQGLMFGTSKCCIFKNSFHARHRVSMLSSSLTDFFTHSLSLSLAHLVSLFPADDSRAVARSTLGIDPVRRVMWPQTERERFASSHHVRAKNTSLLHLSYFILYYLVLRSVLLPCGQRSRWLTPCV